MGENGWTFADGPGAAPRPGQRRRAASTRSTPRPSPTTPAASPCRCCGTSSDRHDRQQRVGRDHPDAQLGLRRRRRGAGRLLPGSRCGARSTRSTPASTTRSTTASTRPASPPTQEAYEEAVDRAVRDARLAGGAARDAALPGRRPRSTEADWRLFTTLVRFDPVYFGHFKCNLRRIADYPNLWATCATSTSCPASPRR